MPRSSDTPPLIPADRPMERRRFLGAGVGASGLLVAGRLPAGLPARAPAAPRVGYPFTLGVASGDPTPDGVVLWTRLAPQPLHPAGGLRPTTINVDWEIATDPRLRSVVRRGRVTASPSLGHSVHVILTGLAPGRDYWYRFRALGSLSPVGRTRTLPAPGSSPASMTFAAVSCQDYEAGYYTPYRYLAADRPDLVFHLGDYIYEFGPGRGLRRHSNAEPVTLAGYRVRYAQYKSDPDLRLAHAASPFVVTWDDHEVDNDYAGLVSQDYADTAWFRRRRAAAYQAFYEHMPIRPPARGTAWAHYPIYRRLRFGDLAEFNVLDGRQYRHDQACGGPGKGGGILVDESCTERTRAGRSMLGAGQFSWLTAGLTASPARWNLIMQQFIMAELDWDPGAGRKWGNDAWDGYPAERARLLRLLADRDVRNPVTFGGDIHEFWVNDLRPDFRNPRSPVVATEFVTTSISSLGQDHRAALPENPHVRYMRNERGYSRCRLTPAALRVDLRGMGPVARRDAPVRTVASWVVENGRAGAQRA